MLDTSTRKLRNTFYSSREWRELRQAILEKNHYECLWCKENGYITTQENATLEVDHIKELEKYPELALDEDNLRVLCRDCHNKRHGRFNYRKSKKRSKWEDDEWW